MATTTNMNDNNENPPDKAEKPSGSKSDLSESEISNYVEILRKRWPEPGPSAASRIKDLTVLVIDDQASIRNIIMNTLNDMGFSPSNIEGTSDGVKAAEKLKIKRYDLIISDWNMPRMTGFQLLQIVKAVPGFNSTPFLMVTAEGQQEKVLQAIKHGVNNYVVKPFTSEQLIGKIKTVLPEASGR
jgi:two-component system chemotaxis response regulator CheY